GSQITAAHGHLAFFGAYSMIVMTIMSYSMPIMRGRPHGNCERAQRLERMSFWTMCIAMCGITLALTVAGVWQIILQRLPDDANALSFMATQEQLHPVFWVRLFFGVMFTTGVGMFFASFFVGDKQGLVIPEGEQRAAS
ncbi:cbb3-type cytochrome c oxidase subunit I, partial [Oleiphilus sp. HI0128]